MFVKELKDDENNKYVSEIVGIGGTIPLRNMFHRSLI